MKRFIPQRGMNDERMNARNACKIAYIEYIFMTYRWSIENEGKMARNAQEQC